MNRQISRRAFVAFSLGTAAVALQGCGSITHAKDYKKLIETDRKIERPLLENYLREKYGFEPQDYEVRQDEPSCGHNYVTNEIASYYGVWTYKITHKSELFYAANNL